MGDTLKERIKHEDNVDTLEEYGLNIDQIKDELEEKQDLQDLKVMYNDMEKSLQLLSKSAVKMVPIPRIG